MAIFEINLKKKGVVNLKLCPLEVYRNCTTMAYFNSTGINELHRLFYFENDIMCTEMYIQCVKPMYMNKRTYLKNTLVFLG